MFNGSLMRLSVEHVQIMGHVTLSTTCIERANAKTIDISYLIVDTMSPYKIILGSPTINALRAVVSTRYLTLKYPLIDARVCTIRRDQQVAPVCYRSILETIGEEFALVDTHPFEISNTHFEF